MNLEDLTKHQILLLTLLVSFVTSLATGIVTVSLMDYAPPSVTKTVNRVVEKTVERVVPPDAEDLPASVETVTEKVVVVERDGTLENAVSSISQGVVRGYTASDPTTASSTGTFVGLGVVIDGGGTVVVDKSIGPIAHVSDLSGNRYNTTLVREGASFAYYEVVSSDGSVPSAAPTQATSELGLGKEVFALSGGSSFSIERGAVTHISFSDVAGVAGATSEFKTDIVPPSAGIPLFTANGTIVALSGKKGESYAFIPIEDIIAAHQSVSVEEDTSETVGSSS